MKMRLFFCMISLVFLVSCNTTQKLYESKNYDEVIDNLGDDARNNSITAEELEMLTKSYHQANEQDHERIIALKKTGAPEIWVEIYDRFISIDKRQKKVERFSDDVKKAMKYKKLDLSDELATSKEKASLYLAAKANVLMQDSVSKKDINETVVLINKLGRIDPHNKDLDRLRLKSILLSSNNIILRVSVPANSSLSKSFKNNLFAFEKNEIYGVPFDIVVNDTVKYDLMIRVNIEKTEVSPERIDAVTFEEKNNDVTAKVTDKTLTKTVTIKGKIEYINLSDNAIRLSTPFDITSTFKYNYAEVTGDKNACSQQTLSLLERGSVKFPSDEALFNDAGRKLNEMMVMMWF